MGDYNRGAKLGRVRYLAPQRFLKDSQVSEINTLQLPVHQMSGLANQDITAIKDLHDRWIANELAGEVSTLVDLCMEDVQLIPPDAPPIVGKDAIAKHLAATDASIEKIEITNLSIQGDGSVAYLISNYRTELATSNSSVHELRGTHMWILGRIEHSRWLIAVMTWNSWVD